MNMTNPVGKGFGTSEFALAVGGVVASLLVSFGVVQVEQAGNVSTMIAAVITGAVALISIWGVITQYVQGRNTLKQQMVEKGIGISQPAPQA